MISPGHLFLPTHAHLAQLCAQETQIAHAAASQAKPEPWCCGCGTQMTAGCCPKCGAFAVLATFDSHPVLQSFQDDIAAWQSRTFPTQPLDGKLAHLCREAAELRASPDDSTEWADVLILVLGAAKSGRTVDDLVTAARIKFAHCQQRQWGPPDAEGVHHHITPIRVNS